MDPHQLQNNLGMNGMQNYQFLMQQQQQQPPQQPQAPAVNQAQFSTFQQLYQTPQMNMFSDPSALFIQQPNQHPNQNLLFQMHAQSQPQMYQQQLYQQQLLQQQQPQQQHQQQQQQQQYIMQQALQQAQHHQQQQQQQQLQQQRQQQLQLAQEQSEAELRQQRLIEQQNRQMELHRKEQEALRRKHDLEEARRQEQMRELQRQEEEKRKRIAEEEERKRIEEKKRQEELRRIEAEEEARKRIAEEANNEILKRSEVIPKPFSLVACAPLTKLTGVLPFPSEAPASSVSSFVCPNDSLNTCLNIFDPETIGIIAEALSAVDISHVMVRGEEVKEEVVEQHSEHPPLIAQLMQMNSAILSVDDEISNLLSAFDGTDMDTSGASDGMGGPSTSSHQPITPANNSEALRRMISLGKQPKGKGKGGGGRKKDMVEDLFDSLTDYFDPSDRRRKRQKVKTYEEEQLETRELEMVAASEIKAKEREKENELMVNDIDQLEEGKFFEKKRAKKKEREPERPPTPTEVLRQREEEWREREKKRHEKRRKRMDESEDHWSNDVRAENESLTRCSTLIDNILDSIDIDATEIDDESEMPQELLIDRGLLEQLRGEVQKLKMYKKMHEVPNDRVTRLLTILERNMRDVIASEGRSAIVPITDEECGEEENELFREMIDDRLQRGADAACTALIAITANKMPKTVFLEDTMERAVQVCKQYLTTIIFPASDILYQGVNKSKRIVEDTPKKKRKLGAANRTPIVQILYTRMLDLMGCFGELVRHHTLPDTFYHQLNTAALSCFFVNNIAELQLKAMTVLANIFSRVDDHIRSPLIQDLLNSLHRLPPKTNMNCYALSNNQTISYSSCLFQLLIQSSIKIPNRRRRKDEDEDDDDIVRDFSKEDGVLRDSIGEAKILCNKFIVGFLTKVVAKGEEEYRNLFSIFLQDLLTSFMVPEWPVAEMVLNGVTGYICTLYRNKVDVAVRCLIMEYLGLICARLSKEKKERGNDTEKRLAMIVKTMLYCERDDERTSLEEIDVSTMSNNDLLRKAERGLIDFLVVSNSSSEFSVEYAVKYYVGDWYRMTMEDIEGSRETYKAVKDAADNDKDRRKADRKLDKVEEKGRKQKEFLLELSDKKMIRKRADQVARSGSVMLNADAAWLIKHLAMNRDFCNSFDVFLKQILMGVTSEGAVGLRTRAMKSLTQIIEVDHTVLGNMDVRRSVQARMTDPNAQVREATIELLGKFIVARPDLIQDYYNIIIERIKDSGTSVRKRIIRIMREYCEKNPEYEKNSEMLSRIVRRVNDEEGVRKLVLDTMGALWLQPVKYKEVLAKKVAVLTEVITILMRESGGLDSLEAVFAALLKSDGEKAAIAATLQIVDTLFDEVIQLDIMVDGDETLSQAEKAKKRQDKMLACLAGLSIFSKVRPVLLLKHIEALQPYLSMSAKTTVEQSVLNQVILMLERVIPLIDHPSAEFISRVDKNLGELVKTTGMTITASAISCAAALHKKSPKLRPCITALFLQYLKGILTWRKKLEVPGTEINQQVMPIIQRSVFALGLMARYYDWDSILSDEEVGALPLLTTQPLIEKNEDETEKEGEGKRAIRDNVYLLLHFFSGHIDPNLRTKALTALGHVSAEYPEYLQRDEVLAIYAYALKSNDRNSLQMKIQALKNLEMFLLNEEKKALKTTQEWERIKDDQELKEMELAGSGLGSAVIQRYWQTVLDSYFHPLVDVRLAAMQVVWQTLSQGLVTPGSSIHVLIAMSTDPIPAIRHKVESLVKDIDNKYQGMVQSKAVQGVRSAFTLQKRVREDVNSFVRGIRAVEQSAMSSGKAVSMVYGAPKNSNDGQALLSGLYQSLRGNKQQRRSLVNSMLRLFTEDTKDTHTLSIDEWIFIADNLAMFPYQVLDEPLYVCKSVESVLTIHGHSMLNQFVSELAPIREGENNDDDYVFMAEPLLGRFPADTTQLYKIMDQSQAYFTLIYLKNFLMKFYSITEARIQEYSTSDTSKGHDKGLARKSITMFQPISSMQQLKPDVRAMRGTRDGNYALACHIAQFRRLLLSIDNKDGEDDDDVKTDNPNQEYDEEEMNMEE